MGFPWIETNFQKGFRFQIDANNKMNENSQINLSLLDLERLETGLKPVYSLFVYLIPSNNSQELASKHLI